MRFVVITGLSGAGKTTGLHALEDSGYFTVDNAPPSLWTLLMLQVQAHEQSKVAVGVDIRTRTFLDELDLAFAQLRRHDVRPEIVFLDASADVLIKRYNFTRRTHPLGQAPLSSDIARERETLGALRAVADVVLDTSSLSVRELTETLQNRFADSRDFTLRLVSFGFKRGVPIDADNVFDLRALPNPYYEPALRPLDGRDPEVQSYVFNPEGFAFYTELCNFVRLLAAQAETAGRSSYTIAVGCTGGQHRSVAIAERLGFDLADTFSTHVEHRDLSAALAEHSP